MPNPEHKDCAEPQIGIGGDGASPTGDRGGNGGRGSGAAASSFFLDYDANGEFFYELAYRLANPEPEVVRPLQEFVELPPPARWVEPMMVENRPPLEISSLGGYRKPKYTWRTPIRALRRPSQEIRGLRYQQSQAGQTSSTNTEALVRTDFLTRKGWVPARGSTDRKRGRPMVENPSKATLRKRKQRERDKLPKDRKVLSMLDSRPTVAERITQA
jgi:hypothetical protein